MGLNKEPMPELIPPGSYRAKFAEVRVLSNVGVTVRFDIEVEGEERSVWKTYRWFFRDDTPFPNPTPPHLTTGFFQLKHLCKLLGTPENFNPMTTSDFDMFIEKELTIDIAIIPHNDAKYNQIVNIYA